MKSYAFLDSPIGRLMLTTDGEALTGLYMDMPCGWPIRTQGHAQSAHAGVLPLAMQQLEEYFAGKRRDFDVPLRLHGTEFQQRVWKTLLEIAHGDTWSYGQMARRIEKPTASRAVGLANGSNPISIIVPCHRVIGANGSLTGYGGGLERKQWLLAHEGWSAPHATRRGKVLALEVTSDSAVERGESNLAFEF